MKSKSELVQYIASELSVKGSQVSNVLALLEDGNTIPFIARYRKEMTGSLDEVEIRTISERWTYLDNLEKRKEEVLRIIEEQGKLTEELSREIIKAVKLQTIEDLYRPFKQKRRTKATVANEKGLEPLAKWIMEAPQTANPLEKAAQFVDVELGVTTPEEALDGAKDIIAENISDNASFRKWIRDETFKFGLIKSVSKDEKKDEKKVFEMYYDYDEAIGKIVPHRILALNRGEKEGVLRVSIKTDTQKILDYLARKMNLNTANPSAVIMKEAIEDSYKRLIQPSIEREIRNELTEKAEDQAIYIFSENLRNLLLQPPLKGKMVLGVDPAYRTGCKYAVVDPTGKMLEVGVIYPHPPVAKKKEATEAILSILKRYNIEIITIGNGTASRETEQFIADTLKKQSEKIYYVIVNEAGASVYSASDIAREEFPDLQVEQRSAVSIARRLQDPLAELVKIDPKSVGVGQYQHDVSEKKLNESLGFVVETAVNRVGVNVNTASPSLLQYVAGLSKSVAQNIVKKREKEGAFRNRASLKKIPRLGAKTYEQAIGFLRVIGGEEPLDRTSIHPENYQSVRSLLKMLGFTTDDLGSERLREALTTVKKSEMAEKLNIGEITLGDILDALMRPERDPRDELAAPLLKSDVLKMEDLKQGMELQGVVRNVVDFGAFIDIGVKQAGLVHISKLSRRYVKHPMDVVSVGDVVTVWVDQVDIPKERIALTMINPAG
ncbi:RNA-binding transcriptional accessory protein [Pradoshia sp. D12]|uniref:Tex family protein n=1 Tax=Bacillaceae TaxID=186817 RepID=UPI00112EA324|nr:MULTISPECIES: Tex family protein [Bacillaceae]QFK70009.1 RNA-binding transcriptional accessory protein [Pradoshia sp. D12]TPF70493.1 RNA-binding transcriptional accessory protein [Bacillus sp. D12]